MQLSKKLVTVAYNLSASPREDPGEDPGEAPPLPPEAKKIFWRLGPPLSQDLKDQNHPPPPLPHPLI